VKESTKVAIKIVGKAVLFSVKNKTINASVLTHKKYNLLFLFLLDKK
jgi:hypothetical protein